MIFRKVLIDTNVCLDVALKRKPFVTTAAKIFERSERKEIAGFVAAHSFDTIFYFLRKTYTKKQTYDAIEGLRRTVTIAAVTKEVIDSAFALKWDDFEDAIHYQSAFATGCEMIVTRNETDFEKADLPVFSPSAFLDHLNG